MAAAALIDYFQSTTTKAPLARGFFIASLNAHWQQLTSSNGAGASSGDASDGGGDASPNTGGANDAGASPSDGAPSPNAFGP
ncbi:hypothetical protein, partial [Bradyrhizobium jicamae]|uniref:hypothetical protein n=1 Tax=Bradyrhizobium jicamae TaxID=280332 RepID=UPI000A8D7481